MNEKLVSIIVPIYNVEKYIKRCVESLKSQSYKNIEIILVDDGSPDESSLIIDVLAKTDPRITVIHKKNGGVSSARNAGLNIAQGEYVMFVDGDDWVDNDYVAYFVSLAQTTKCKIILDTQNYVDNNGSNKTKHFVVNSEKAIEWIYLGKVKVAVWNKLYNLKYLNDYNIRFDESIWFGEGMLFNIDCLQYVDKVAIGEKCVYHQVSNPDSAMRKFNLESIHCGIRSLYVQKEHWQKKNKRIESAWNYHRRAFNWTIFGGLASSGQDRLYQDEYKQCAMELRRNLKQSLCVDIPIKEKFTYICLFISPYVVGLIKRYKGSKNSSL